MSRRISLCLAIAILTAVAVFPLTALGQSQDAQSESVADAARHAREKKKAAEKQPAPIITDDTLKPSAPASPEANAPAPAPSSEAAPASPSAAQPAADSSGAPNANVAPGASATDAEQKGQASAELAGLKQQLAGEQKALELLQRDLALQQDTYISNPDHSHDTAGKAKLDAMQQQIADKQQEVDALKTRLAALGESLKDTAPPAPAAPTAPPSAPPPQP
jgi:uncharacterized coiled-coil protein SlyX